MDGCSCFPEPKHLPIRKFYGPFEHETNARDFSPTVVVTDLPQEFLPVHLHVVASLICCSIKVRTNLNANTIDSQTLQLACVSKTHTSACIHGD